MNRPIFSDAQMLIVQHCAQECEYQRSGEMSVFWMLDAWRYAQACAKHHRPTVLNCTHLGSLVEPKKNAKGFRRVGVRVGYDVKMPYTQVSAAMERLFNEGTDLSPAEFFREYEEIHPFVDGNGRTGNILYNWLNGTLDEPLMPPEFWGSGHRIVGSVRAEGASARKDEGPPRDAESRETVGHGIATPSAAPTEEAHRG